MVTILMIPAKMATLDLLKIKVFWNKGYDVIVFVYDAMNKNLSRDSNYTVYVVKSLVTLALPWKEYDLNFIIIWPEKPLLLRGGLG